jgi:hypothetical protein
MKDRVLEMKVASSVLALCAGLAFAGCGKSDRADRAAGNGGGTPILTKEQVGAILGQPVTSVEGTRRNLKYKTAVMLLETTIELEDRGDVSDAVPSMNGARTGTGFLGGQPDPVPGLGDEALFGVMSALYLRKGSAFIHIQPPNLQMIAASKAAEGVRVAKLGSAEQVRALEVILPRFGGHHPKGALSRDRRNIEALFWAMFDHEEEAKCVGGEIMEGG